jgi:hypothetical protein
MQSMWLYVAIACIAILGLVIAYLVPKACASEQPHKVEDDDGNVYIVRTKRTLGATKNWLKKYRGRICSRCGLPIFPRHRVGRNPKTGRFYHHGPIECHPPGMEWGILDKSGERGIPAYPDRMTAAQLSARLGGGPVAEIPKPTLNECDFVLLSLIPASRIRK